jgi:hypothetical protein
VERLYTWLQTLQELLSYALSSANYLALQIKSY